MVRKKARQKLMLLAYDEIDHTSWTSGIKSIVRNIKRLPLNVVMLKAHVIADYETDFDNGVGDIESQVTINLDSNAQLHDGKQVYDLTLGGTDTASVAWLPDTYDVHMFPMLGAGRSYYSSHITDIYLNMASNDLELTYLIRDGFGGTTSPVAGGQINFWILLEVEVL